MHRRMLAKAKRKSPRSSCKIARFSKLVTGIGGLDEILNGGLPEGRPTLVCGGAGCGKTMLALEFILRGAVQYGQPGVFVTFDETPTAVGQTIRSMGFDYDRLTAKGCLAILDGTLDEDGGYNVAGAYDLEGLFVRLGHMIDSRGAKRVAIDSIDTLFSKLPDLNIMRAEISRLLSWLRGKGVTAVLTSERGQGQLSRHGIEEYLPDCVILLDHRAENRISTRYVRVVKYRGSSHSSDEHPFMIESSGFTVVPVTSLGLEYRVCTKRISTGVARLDTMLGGKGYFRGSTVLVSGTSGTGKSTLAATFVVAACRRGERSLYFASEESPDQIMRNMRSVGIDMKRWIDRGVLRFHAVRPTACGLETRLAEMSRLIREYRPKVVAVDPITSLQGSETQVKLMLIRLVDILKCRGISSLLTSLTVDGSPPGESGAEVSSLIDTWIVLQNSQSSGERDRLLTILKSRGMAHSHQVREFRISGSGIDLADVYVGDGRFLTGVARVDQEAKEQAELKKKQSTVRRKKLEMAHRKSMLDSQVALVRAELEAGQVDLETLESELEAMREQRQVRSDARGADKVPSRLSVSVKERGAR